MKFLAQNWFFIIVLVWLVLMMSRHGGCGMHGGHGGHEHESDIKSDTQEEEEVHAHHH